MIGCESTMTKDKDLGNGPAKTFPGLLRVVLDTSLPKALIAALHSGGDALDSGALARASPGIVELLRATGAEKVSPVYELSPQEVDEDKYGFARELKLYLGPGIDAELAVQALSRSPFVESCRISGIRSVS